MNSPVIFPKQEKRLPFIFAISFLNFIFRHIARGTTSRSLQDSEEIALLFYMVLEIFEDFRYFISFHFWFLFFLRQLIYDPTVITMQHELST